MTLDEIKRRIESAIPEAAAEIIDLGGGDHIRAIVISPVFRGLPLLKQHKMILDLFEKEIASNEVHALTVKTMTPEQISQ